MMSTTNHKYTTIGIFDDTKKALDKIIFLESAKHGEKITYDEYIRRKLIKKVKKHD
jgi:glycine cleavage system H lipoate-binding protein